MESIKELYRSKGLTTEEMRKIHGSSGEKAEPFWGITGTRLYNGQCYCDLTFEEINPDGSHGYWHLCDSPCDMDNCM